MYRVNEKEPRKITYKNIYIIDNYGENGENKRKPNFGTVKQLKKIEPHG